MHISMPCRILFGSSLLLFACSVVNAQLIASTKRNNPYSPSPVGKPLEQRSITKPVTSSGIAKPVFIVQSSDEVTSESRLTAVQTPNFARTSRSTSVSPSEIYKVGIGDILFVELKNTAQGSCYCTVRPDGTIDFPLAGDDVTVAGQTTDVVAEIIRSGITLFSDPHVEVTVREYGSHKITVSGMVENPGEKSLRREAMPLYAVRSEAGVDPKATKVVVKRAPLLKVETYDLREAATNDVMISPGNSVEFTSGNIGSYYLTGKVSSSGQKEITEGLTLYQAVVASGPMASDAKKATIRRKSGEGAVSNTAYNLRSIKDGKTADPLLASGDVIEVKK